MVFFIVCICMFFSVLNATSLDPEQKENYDTKKSNSLLERKDFLGNKNLQIEGAISLRRLSNPINVKTLFSGREIDFQKEKKVIGRDERRIIAGSESWHYPGACIASLEIFFENFTSLATGFLVSPTHVMTASHNLYDEKDSKINSITCYFGRYNNYVKDFSEVEGFTLHEASKSKKHSFYSLLVLKKSVGLKVGYLMPTLFNFEEHWISIQGYPAYFYGEEEEKVNNSCQYQSSSTQIYVKKEKLYYCMQATSGQSGSPILIMAKKDEDLYPCFIGMHMYGAENIKNKKIENKKYPYHGLYVTDRFLKGLESLLISLESLENSSQDRIEPFLLKTNVYFHSLKDKESKKGKGNTRLYNDISTDSSLTSLDELPDIKPSPLEEGKISFEKANYEQAKTLFKKAKKTNSSEASFELAKTYSKLAEVTIFEKRAFKYYLKAAQKGKQAQDQFEVAEKYYKGVGVQKNCKEALIWYRKAADQNHAKAQFLLGNCYYYGYGTKVNITEANRFYNLAQKNGYDSFYYCFII
ncbi:MAG: trypsin-like serine protease [Janthinobacterium lividum]